MNIVVRWYKMGPEFSYHIWYATNLNGPWIRDNHSRLTDDSSEVNYNEYIIENLEEQKKYSVKVTCSDRYYDWWYSFDGAKELSGGLGAPHTTPSPDWGNVQGFQFYVDIVEPEPGPLEI